MEITHETNIKAGKKKNNPMKFLVFEKALFIDVSKGIDVNMV